MKKLKLVGYNMLSKEQMKKVTGGNELYDAAFCQGYPSWYWCYPTPVSWLQVVEDGDYEGCPSGVAGHWYGTDPWPDTDCHS